MELLQSFQPGSVVLTLGEKGLLFSQKDKQSGKWSAVEHIEAEKVEAVDSTVSGHCYVLYQMTNLPHLLATPTLSLFHMKSRRARELKSYE